MNQPEQGGGQEMEAACQRAAQIFLRSRNAVFLTGAGMSQESGIPTFREALTGLWSQYDPAELATEPAFRRNPDFVFSWYLRRFFAVRKAEPNAGHRAIAALESVFDNTTLATQNVDGLHRRAGSSNILELHGSLEMFRCVDCQTPFPEAEIAAIVLPETEGELVATPSCGRCGGAVRPGVVWFGETLPPAATRDAWQAANDCDLMVVVGTSAQVYPVAELPFVARRSGASIVEINPEPTPVSEIAACAIRAPAAVALGLIARLTEQAAVGGK